MLVISRHFSPDNNGPKSKLTVTAPNGDVIVITVIKSNSNSQVKIGIEANKDYSILRNEIINDGKDRPQRM